ncbi:MAG: hypothetical protein K0B10_11940 [Vicingaceae bacterium]|nr:hypothetical protein [Vicingaceae bacterium]
MNKLIRILTFNTSAMLSACFLLSTFNLVAQPTIEWEKNLGGSDSDVAYEVTQTTNGGYIVVGVTLSNDGDVTLNHGVSDGWIVKLNNVGIIEWGKSYGGSNDDVINTISQTTDGGYIAVGFSRSSNGDIVNSHGGSDVWVIKIDALGNINWSKSYGGSGDEKGNSVKQTSDGGYVVAGVTSSSNGDVSINKGLNDYWIFKIDGAGNLQWEKTYGGSGNEEAHSVIQKNDGGYVLAGLTFSVDGDVTNPKGGGDDYWIIRLDSLGILQWEKSYGGSLNDRAFTIQETFDGGFVIVGTSSSKDGDVMSALGAFGFGAWVIKIDSLGTLQWEKACLRIGANTMLFKYVGNLTNDGGYIVSGTTNNGTNNGTQVDYWLF